MENQENQQRHDLPEDDRWIDEILESPTHGDEILPDEDAIASAGLTHPSDAEVEQIIQEALAEFQEEPSKPEEIPMDATRVIEQPFKDAEYRDAFGEGEDLESIFATGPAMDETPPARKTKAKPAPVEEFPAAEEEESAPPSKKKRPRRKGKDNLLGLSHLLVTFVWIAIIVFIGVTLANVLWVCASDVLAFGRENREISVSIEDSDTMEDISRKLYDAGLIRYPNLFSLYAQFTDAREDIGSGTFTLNTIYDYHALVNFMNSDSAERQIVEVVIP